MFINFDNDVVINLDTITRITPSETIPLSQGDKPIYTIIIDDIRCTTKIKFKSEDKRDEVYDYLLDCIKESKEMLTIFMDGDGVHISALNANVSQSCNM